MNPGLALLCSPRPGGVSDELAREFFRGYESVGRVVDIIALRDAAIPSCDNCGYCRDHPGSCKFDSDVATRIFERMFEARLVVISTPIYFYNVPARFKALIDRSQKFWPPREARRGPPAIVLLAAGREKGENLFNCSRITIRYFLECLRLPPLATRAFGGLENTGSISEKVRNDLREFGAAIARAERDA